MESIVDWACASSLDIEPVASMQKHTSIKPKAGIGKWSFDLVLNTVFFKLVGGGTKAGAGPSADLDALFFADFFVEAGFEPVLVLSLDDTALI